MRSRTWTMALGSWLLLGAAAAAQPASSDQGFVMALTGDSIITRRLSVYQEPEFLRMIELIREADVAFTNVEMLFHDFESFPMHRSGGTYMRAEPALAKELAWAGFDLGSLANNHTGDYGVPAMRLTQRHVAEAGIVAAGTGDSLAEAREAKFLETTRARVALISTASTFPDHARAGRSRDDVPPRPGLSPLRFSTTYVVSRDRLDDLSRLREELGLDPPQGEEGKEGELSFLRNRFVAGEPTGVRTEVNRKDLDEIRAVVANASRLADYTILTFHGHESQGERSVPAQFLVDFARSMVEAGADVVVGHGPHVLRGIEIFEGKPIFYSLGDFLFQNDTLLRLPHENYEPYDLGSEAHVADFNDARYDYDKKGFPANPEIWESVVARLVWSQGQLAALELHPISLGFGKPRTVRGRPMLADPELARKIVGDLQQRSKEFGTTIDFRDGIGVVRLPGGGTH